MSLRPTFALVCSLAAAAALVGASAWGLAQAQPFEPPAGVPPAGAPLPGEEPSPLAEEPPPAAALESPGAAPAAPTQPTIADVKEVKEKPAATTPLPEKAPVPLKRPRRGEAIIQALDKVTAQTVRFPAAVNRPVRWKDLVFTIRSCELPAADESQKGAFAHMEIFSEPKVGPGRTPPPAKLVYRGWMYAEAPAVHPFEHPVYDVWLIACRTA